MKILLTGCNGFVGRHAVDALLRSGHEVIGSDIVCKAATQILCHPLDVRDLDAIIAKIGRASCRERV